MNKEDIRRVLERFTEKSDFRLNTENKIVDMLIDGLAENEKRFGLRLCPCRIRDGTREGDLKLICPCNFKAQDKWKERGQCWCGLFVKR